MSNMWVRGKSWGGTRTGWLPGNYCGEAKEWKGRWIWKPKYDQEVLLLQEERAKRGETEEDAHVGAGQALPHPVDPPQPPEAPFSHPVVPPQPEAQYSTMMRGAPAHSLLLTQ